MNAFTPADLLTIPLIKLSTGTPTLSIVCPFHNEEEGIEAFFAAMHRVLGELGETYEIVCVNDGSRDRTLALLQAEQQRHSGVRVIDLSRNFGKEAALTAGIEHALGRAVIPIDADLQDPPELIPAMVAKWREGHDVVLARRTDRASDSWAKRLTARAFYRVHNRIADVPIPDNVGDFRLMDRRVIEALRQLPERRRFMKGLFGWVGFRTTTVDYIRPPRTAGSTKFNGWGLWNLAIEGITAFSTMPLRVWTYVGLMVSSLAFVYAAYIVFRTLVHGVDVPGYASMLTAVLMLGGIQLIGLGVIGEYVGRIYAESKQRPVYLVRDIYEGREA
ncbi:MAG: glycosyltransferase family 2 protein [Leptothrix sp. (in: b-proteobacteria)]